MLVLPPPGLKFRAATAQSPPPPRPTLPPSPPEPAPAPGPPSGPASRDRDSSDNEEDRPAYNVRVHGVVIHWGYRNEPQNPILLSGPGGDWQTKKSTDDNGYYAFDGLGLGVGLLNLVPPPGLTPLTTDVAIRLGYRNDQEVNLGFYGGPTAPTLPLVFTMTTDRAAFKPGEMVTYQIRVVNPLDDQDIERHLSGVLITDLLPEELEITDVSTTQGTVEVWGNLVTADVGTLTPGERVAVSVKVVIRDSVPSGISVTNKASLIYDAGIAQQTKLLVSEVIE